ncbi:Nuclear receptor-interacting protein 2 [Bagarius yarrelli]|uniref:Nuclear receptor-interacting protein 2 n=1 Tax=Bagarius yarrelli TaxID=175774 RepID=A0A556TI78_BAGYA|nr:Nuclear receptor-interacting protein 2 [Bagarius yarrelli]
MSESKKQEVELRDKAIMHQQRRLKQATQFTHKDSADLLPLDGLKRLGTSKDLQPHSIVQRRLLEGNISRLCGETRDTPSRVRSPLADNKVGAEAEDKSESTIDDSTEERESPEESERSLRSDEEEEHSEHRDAVGKAEHKEAGLDRGEKGEEESEGVPALSALQVKCKIQLGSENVQCTAQVIDDEAFELCLGLQTLLELKCCVDLNRRVLHLYKTGEELPFLETPNSIQCHQRYNNKNL